ncbi:MAG: LacI family DNA-binding transcriptional regulator [Pseudomonadota bacterium]|nr:LacI family DNA-binding transcriptional regulator [Pseudomonadota bacterium]
MTTRHIAKTMADIARLAGVSTPTVSRALQNSPLVTDETRKHVVAIAERHGYAINRSAQNLRRKRTGTIIVVVDFPSLPGHRITDPFHFEALANVVNALAARSQDVLLVAPPTVNRNTYPSMLANKGADGLIFLGQGGHPEIFRDLAKSRIPFVVWGGQVSDATYCVIGSDNLRGGDLAAERFAALKRRRVLFVGPRNHVEIDARREGFRKGMRARVKAGTVNDLIVEDLSYVTAHTAMDSYLDAGKPPPDALFAASDTIAMGAIASLRRHGVKVPADCSVIGYDDSPAALYHTPALTTIRQDTRLGGALMVENLMQILDGATRPAIVLPTQLIVRET